MLASFYFEGHPKKRKLYFAFLFIFFLCDKTVTKYYFSEVADPKTKKKDKTKIYVILISNSRCRWFPPQRRPPVVTLHGRPNRQRGSYG